MFRAASVHDSKMSKVLKRQGEQIHQGAWKALENNSRCQPDGCRSWLVCAASLLSVVVVSGIAFSYGLLLPSLMDAFEATRQETAWIGTLYVGFSFFVAPISSFISDHFSFRLTAILGSLLGIIGFTLASWSSHVWIMYLTFGIISGVGHGLIFNSSVLVILQHFVKWRSVAVGIVASAPAIGMFAFSQTTRVLLSTFGWRGTMIGYAILFFFCGLSATVFVTVKKFKEDDSDINSYGIKQEESKTSSLLGNRPFLILFTSFVFINMSYFVPSIHLVRSSLRF